MSETALKESDCAVLLELWNQSADHDSLTEDLLKEKVWLDPDFDEDLCVLLEENNRKVGFAVGVVRTIDEREVGYVKLVAVDAKFQGRGFGRLLVQGLEDRLKEKGVKAIRVGESAPNYLLPGIDVRYTRAMLMFEAMGYQRLGETYNLTAELDADSLDVRQATSDLEHAGIRIKRYSNDDSESLRRFLVAFWPAWQSEVAVAKSNQQPSLHLAVEDDQVVGFSAYDSNNLGTGWFGPMGTHPDFRGRGIGEVLLKLCLADIHRQGHSSAIIPWVGPVKFYSRHVGARIDRIFYRYEKAL